MRIHYFQHVPFEGLGLIANWAFERGHTLTSTKFHDEESSVPPLGDYDALIVMGGPMGVYDDKSYPWLAGEIDHIRSAIEASKPVLGICLGAQLIAASLGARVASHSHKEIGWFPIALRDETSGHPMFAGLHHEMTVLHWHGDRFEIPAGAIPFASSQVCDNQGFLYHDHVLALQFHLEMDEAAVRTMVEACRHELIPGEFVQTAEEIMSHCKTVCNDVALQTLLGRWLAGSQNAT